MTLLIFFGLLRFVVFPLIVPRIMKPIIFNGLEMLTFRYYVYLAFCGLMMLQFASFVLFCWSGIHYFLSDPAGTFWVILGMILFVLAWRYLAPPLT